MLRSNRSNRNLVIRVASTISALAMITAVIAVGITRQPSTAAASAAFHGRHVTITAKSTTHSRHLLGDNARTTAANRSTTAQTKKFNRKEFNVSKQGPSKSNATAPRVNAPAIRLGPQIGSNTTSANFNGLASLDNDVINGFEVTPPDQGLCVGYDAFLTGRPKVVLELVNEAIAEYTTSGTLLGEDSLSDFFNTPYDYGDVRCVYDPRSQSLYFTELDLPYFFGASNTLGADLLQINTITGSRSEYFIDWTDPTNGGCPCLGDQMRIGFDNYAIYLTADEFPLFGAGPTGTGYNGSEMYAISKQDVLVGASLPAAYYYNNLSLAGIPVLGLMPAISESSTGTEWLANSFPYDAAGNNNSISSTIGLWYSTGDSQIETTEPTIHAKIVNTETYAYPVTAVTTTGSSTSIDQGDDRIGQIEYLNNHLYTTIETAFNASGDPTTYDGIAWLDIGTVNKWVHNQGYIAFKGDYLVYPSITRTPGGVADVNYTVTNSGLNPSAAFSSRSSDKSKFSGPHIAAYGITPLFDFGHRFGDYSFSALDPSRTSIWMANEYVPALADQGFFTNWGTRIFHS